MSLHRDGPRFNPFCCPLYCWGPEPPSNVSKSQLLKRGEPEQRFEPTAMRAFVYKSSALPGVPENLSIPDLPTLFSQTLEIFFLFSSKFKAQMWDGRRVHPLFLQFRCLRASIHKEELKKLWALDVSTGIALADIYTKILIHHWRIPKFQYIFPFQGRHSSSCFVCSCCSFEYCSQTSALIMMQKKLGWCLKLCWKNKEWFNSTLFCMM